MGGTASRAWPFTTDFLAVSGAGRTIRDGGVRRSHGGSLTRQAHAPLPAERDLQLEDGMMVAHGDGRHAVPDQAATPITLVSPVR